LAKAFKEVLEKKVEVKAGTSLLKAFNRSKERVARSMHRRAAAPRGSLPWLTRRPDDSRKQRPDAAKAMKTPKGRKTGAEGKRQTERGTCARAARPWK